MCNESLERIQNAIYTRLITSFHEQSWSFCLLDTTHQGSDVLCILSNFRYMQFNLCGMHALWLCCLNFGCLHVMKFWFMLKQIQYLCFNVNKYMFEFCFQCATCYNFTKIWTTSLWTIHPIIHPFHHNMQLSILSNS